MFSPVDPTRRRFLSQPAGVAVGGTVLAVAAIPPVARAAAPFGVLGPADPSNISPALLAEARGLDDAHGRVKAATAANDAANATFDTWALENPEPESKRGKRRWIKKANAYHRRVMAGSWQVLVDAESDFQAAQNAVAGVPAASLGELQCKAALAFVYEKVPLARGNRAPISRMVAFEFLQLSGGLSS